MPSILCQCGNRISLGEIPSPNQYLIISDKDYDNFQGNIDSEKLYRDMKIVALCNICKRIHIFWNGFDQPPTSYLCE